MPEKRQSIVCRCLSLSLIVIVCFFDRSETAILRKSSQCFKSHGIPRVSLECRSTEMILIARAFHGIGLSDRRLVGPGRPGPGPGLGPGAAGASAAGSPSVPPSSSRCYSGPGFDPVNCTYCEGDCIDDSMNQIYDWSTCLGFGSCVRTVMQSHMPACPGRDKFSDYLQVEYQCIQKIRVFDVCSESRPHLVADGHVTSPGYPSPYPADQDCLCRMVADREEARITLVFYDVTLETKDGRCRADWVMLRQNAERHRHCGAMIYGTRNVTSSSNAIDVQFHSDGNDVTVQNFNYFTRKLKGFWIFFKADRGASVQMSCRRLDVDDPAVKEFESEDTEEEEREEEDYGAKGTGPSDPLPPPPPPSPAAGPQYPMTPQTNGTLEELMSSASNSTSSGSSSVGALSISSPPKEFLRLITLVVTVFLEVTCC